MFSSRSFDRGSPSSTDNATAAQGVVILSRDAAHERRADYAFWLLNHLHVPFTLRDMDSSQYEVIDIISNNKIAGGVGSSVRNTPSSIHTSTRSFIQQQQQHSSSEKQKELDASNLSLVMANMERKFKFTEDTLFWTINQKYNVVFVLDISQSMYSLDPTTNRANFQIALDTLEKCLMGMVQPFTITSGLGLPDWTISPHICTSIIGYCPRYPGTYPNDKNSKKFLPFCKTLVHAHMVTEEGIPSLIKSIRLGLFNHENELQDSLGCYPPPPPPIPATTDPMDTTTQGKSKTEEASATPSDPKQTQHYQHQHHSNSGSKTHRHSRSFENSAESGHHQPRAGDIFTFSNDPDSSLLHSMQIADYFLKLLPDVCAPVFVYLTDGVMRSNFTVSKTSKVTGSLSRRNTQCTFIQVGSGGGFTPETTLGYVNDSELLLYLAASLDGRFVYASDCPDTVQPRIPNFYHQAMLIHETRLSRTLVRHRYDSTCIGGRRLGDMPREKLITKRDGNMASIQTGDPGFPWCADCKPPMVDTVTARYNDCNLLVSMNALIEARINEGFTIRNIQISKHDPEGLAERVSVKLELVWHPNVTIIYRITNIYYIGYPGGARPAISAGSSSDKHDNKQSGILDGSSALNSSSLNDPSLAVGDRGQRSPNIVDIAIRSQTTFTFLFLNYRQSNNHKGDMVAKVAMLHSYLKSITEKDERLRQLYTIPSNKPSTVAAAAAKGLPPTFIQPEIPVSMSKLRAKNQSIQSGDRVFIEEVDLSVFLKYTDWTPHHCHLYDIIRQLNKTGNMFNPLANFRHVASMFIESHMVESFVTGIDFTESAKYGQKILNDFRTHVCQFGTWALLKDERFSLVFLRDNFRLSNQIPVFVITRWELATNWTLRVTFNLFNGTADARKVVMDCLPTFSGSFKPDYGVPDTETVTQAIRPLNLLPMDLDLTPTKAPNMLTTRDMGDMHVYEVVWEWSYLAREGISKDLYGEGSDREIVRQALHRLAMMLGLKRLTQDFTLINAKGQGTGLTDSPGASDYETCLTFYHEREPYDVEELLLACQYQIIVDMKRSSVTVRTWIEPWSARLIRMLFEEDFRLLAPLGTFQQILQYRRCFQLKVPNLAEFHSKRMNLFSIMSVLTTARIALRTLQMPDVTPASAVWDHPDGADSIKIDDPTYEIYDEFDRNEEFEVFILDEEGNEAEMIPGKEYFKNVTRSEGRDLVKQKKIRINYVGSPKNDRRAILLERFMLTMFEKEEEGKYDPYLNKYRKNEYNPFILTMVNRDHPRKLFFSKLTAKWMSTGEFTMVAYRCFLEFALFKHCDAVSVNVEKFNKLKFASNIVTELAEHNPSVRQATTVPNALEEHLYLDKWFVIRLPNQSTFLMVILPNTALSSNNRHLEGPNNKNGKAKQGSSSGGHQRKGSDPANAPVFSPALESSIKGASIPENSNANSPTAINYYTLVMECRMGFTQMKSHVNATNGHSHGSSRTTLNLHPLNTDCRDTRVLGETMQGFVGHEVEPIPFTEDALEEIKKLERMYSEAYLQTIYLALLMKRNVSPADLVACQQSNIWTKRSIDIDITAFLHSQDVARESRGPEWRAHDNESLQGKFVDILDESFLPLPFDVDPSQGKYYFCRSSTTDKRSELEICLQLAQNPLFINIQCSVEVIDGKAGHKKKLNMPVDALPLSLEKLCEQAGFTWRPPMDHFEPLTNVRVILHINCLYLPDETLLKNERAKKEQAAAGADNTSRAESPSVDNEADSGDAQQANNSSGSNIDTPYSSAETNEAIGSEDEEEKPDKKELASRTSRPFQKTMSLSSLVSNSFDPAALISKDKSIDTSKDTLPSAVVAKQHIKAQMDTLEGLPHDQIELVKHCHRKLARFIAQETLLALRDIHPVTVPMLRQVWHTVATTVDDEVLADGFLFSHNRFDLKFLTTLPNESKKKHAIGLVLAELLKRDGSQLGYPLGKLHLLDGTVYMRDVRSRSDRLKARERLRVRAQSDSQNKGRSRRSRNKAKAGGGNTAKKGGVVAMPTMEELSDSIPSWFLIKPMATLDGVRILTHNYSAITGEAAESVLATTRQQLMVALKAANTRLLLEEMAETHQFPQQLLPPDEIQYDSLSRMLSTSGSRLGIHLTDQQQGNEGISGIEPISGDLSASSLHMAASKKLNVDRAPNNNNNQPSAQHGKSEVKEEAITAASEAEGSSLSSSSSSSSSFDHTESFSSSLTSKEEAAQEENGEEEKRKPGNSFDIETLLQSYMPDYPDYYSCIRQFTRAFPIHPRISPTKAVQAVMTSVVINNRLENKQNMFFIRDGDSIFYGLLTIDRFPYENPFGSATSQQPPRGSSKNLSRLAISQAATPSAGPASPVFNVEAVMPGAYTVATTSPDPAGFFPTQGNNATSSQKHQSHLRVEHSATSARRRSPLAPILSAGNTPLTSAISGTMAATVAPAPAPAPAGSEYMIALPSRTAQHITAFGRDNTGSAYQPVVAVTAGSPSNHYMLSTTSNPGRVAQHMPTRPFDSMCQLGDGSQSAQNTQQSQGNIQHANQQGQPPLLDHKSQSTAVLNTASTASLFDRYNRQHSALIDSIPADYAEEKTIPYVVLHIFGVDKPTKDMTQALVQQIRERITVHVTMPEMSEMLLRRIVLNDHDMSFLFPLHNPEPSVVYLPLPQFVHDLNGFMCYFRQALGEAIVPFPASELLAKAIRRSFRHLQNPCKNRDDGDGQEGEASHRQPMADNLVPDSLRADLSRMLEGWGYDRETSRRVPVERLTFMYNFNMRMAPPPPDLTGIGTGIATMTAIPLSKHRTVSSAIWEGLSSNHQGRQYRRPSLASSPSTSLSPSSSDPTTTTDHTTDSNMTGDNGNSLPRELSVSELAGLFNRYLQQFKEAHTLMKFEDTGFTNLSKRMDSQVAEFSGMPVMAVVMWNNAGIRLERLAAHISRIYWNALGDYVSEKILHPVLSAGWSSYHSTNIILPDPYVPIDSCFETDGHSGAPIRSSNVVVKLAGHENVVTHVTHPHLTFLRTRDATISKVPSTFTEATKQQFCAMEIARQMAQYWGSQEAVKSVRYYRERLPRVTAISHWFSDELRGIFEAMVPAMHSSLFHLLENPLVLEGSSQPLDNAPKPLFPAKSLRKPGPSNQTSVIYDVSALPKALKGTRQSFCIMSTLPLDDLVDNRRSHSLQDTGGSASVLGSGGHGISGSTSGPNTVRGRNTMLSSNQRHLVDRDHSHNRMSNYSSTTTATGANVSTPGGSQLHGLGLYGWNPSSSSSGDRRHPVQQQPLSRMSNQAGNHKLRHAANSRKGANMPHMTGWGLSPHRYHPFGGRGGRSSTPKKMPSASEYKPIADPEIPMLSAEEITYYALNRQNRDNCASSSAWLVVWLVGGELEMVGYNLSQKLWDNICDQIRQRLERENRRKQLLGMFAAHMGGIFPGYDRQARHQGLSSTWLDRNVTRDLINKFALLKQVTLDDQIHYFNIRPQISADYARALGLFRGSKALEELTSNPPVAEMTANDMETELVLRQMQPEHLRWARKLTFVDYTQPYVDTYHPDTLFRIGSRFMRAYQGRIGQVLRYDELMRIAERWRQLVNANWLSDNMAKSLIESKPSIKIGDKVVGKSSSHTQTSSSTGHQLHSQTASTSPALAPVRSTDSGSPAQAPSRGDHSEMAKDHNPSVSSTTKGKEPETIQSEDKATKVKANGESSGDEISLDDIKMLIENSRLLHFVCAPLPLTHAIKPVVVDLRGFTRLFRVISAMLQNLADSYIGYLCCTGYIVARRYEKKCSWKEALTSLGYESGLIDQITHTVLSGSRNHRQSHNRPPAGSIAASLPSIQVPCVYLIANTERTNLVTQIEVNPIMLTIRMYALSRSTPEWRSAVPGYVKSSFKPKSIKKFTFELSKFKKLLHAKSFVYDFQLRYATGLLKPATSSDSSVTAPNDGHQKHPSKKQTIYSSESESIDSDSESDSAGSGVFDSGEYIQVKSDKEVDGQRRSKREGEDDGNAFQKNRHLTVAQTLDVWINLGIFFKNLSEQRYFSTRFSTRRLVRARFPVKYDGLYEYFLEHCEKYHFYTSGCRATDDSGHHLSLKSSPSTTDSNGMVCTADLSSDSATHSSCYRMYEDVFTDLMQTQYGGLLGNSHPVNEDDGVIWPPLEVAATNEYLSMRAEHASTSAPEIPMSPSAMKSKSAGSGRHGHLSGNYHYHTSDRPTLATGGAMKPQLFNSGFEGKKQMAASYAPGLSQWLGGVNKPKGHYSHIWSNNSISIPTPLRPGSVTSYTSRPQQQQKQNSEDIKDENRRSFASKSLDFAMEEYSACKIYMSSNDAHVRVSLMAISSDCIACGLESNQEHQATMEGQKVHANDHHHRHHHHKRHYKHHATRKDKQAQDMESPRRRHKQKGNKVDDHIDNMDNMFSQSAGKQSSNKGKFSYRDISGRRQHPLGTAATAPNIEISSTTTSVHSHKDPLGKWMKSLSSNHITDPHTDGLEFDSINASPQNDCLKMSYYLVVDMDPTTTIKLKSLQADDMHSRNGSLGPMPDQSDHVADIYLDDIGAYGGRQCEKCASLSLRSGGMLKMCGIHKVLDHMHVDMRDWESRGTVWANTPTMVMEVSEMHPDEYEKEDADTVRWIEDTARRLIRYTVLDYHRDFNWYLIYQSVRRADLPQGLVPNDIDELIRFVERQDWIDIGSEDETIQQILDLDISAQKVIEALQIRIGKLFGEEEAVSNGSAGIPHVARTSTGGIHKSTGTTAAVLVGLTSNNNSELNASYLVPPAASAGQLSLRRQSTIDLAASASAADVTGADSCNARQHGIENDLATAMMATVDPNGHVIYSQSSEHVDQMLNGLSPLGTGPSSKLLLDPSFQRAISSYLRLTMVDSAWLCRKHCHTVTAPLYSLRPLVLGGGDISGNEFYSSIHGGGGGGGTSVATTRSIFGRRGSHLARGLSIASANKDTSSAASSMRPTGGAMSTMHRKDRSIGGASSITSATDQISKEEFFGSSRIEPRQGTLLVVDAADTTKLLVANPFVPHSMLELVFDRTGVEGRVKLSEVRSVVRSRDRDGLYEYERRLVNLVLPTIAAVVWENAI